MELLQPRLPVQFANKQTQRTECEVGGLLEQGKEAQTLAASEKKLKQPNLKT